MKNYKLAGIERRGDLLLGLILKQETDKTEIYLETGEKAKIATSKILYMFKTSCVADNEKTMKIALKTANENFQKQTVDLSILWECCDLDDEYSFQDLAASYFQDLKDDNVGALWISLSNKQPHFTYRNGYFVKVSKELVEANLRRALIEEQNRTVEDNLLSWLQDKDVIFNPEVEPAKKLLDSLKKYALEGEDKATPEAKRFANILSLTADDALALLEQKGVLPKDINETLYRLGISWEFSSSLFAESERIRKTPTHLENRRYLKDFWNIAIDDIETFEVDDAISYYQEDGYHVIGVHIADVASCIEKDSELDRFAQEHFSNVYFPDQKYFIFPVELVKECLTLDVGVGRPTISGFFYFNDQGDLIKYHFEQTVLELARRGTYEQTSPNESLGQEEEFLQIQKIALQLREKRRLNGAVIAEIPDIKIKISDGDVTLKLLQPMPGNLVVSELMILFNTEVAKYFMQNKAATLFRLQSAPTASIADISPDDPLYPLKIRWSLPSASLSLEPGTHYTLASPAYLQATSPMRRYSDLIIQRQLVALLRNEPLPYNAKDLQRIKLNIERMEKMIKNAEHLRSQYWIYKYLQKTKGEQYTAFISRFLDNDKVLVFLPELMQEFLFKPIALHPEIGQKLYLRSQGASPRKKKVRFEEIPQIKQENKNENIDSI